MTTISTPRKKPSDRRREIIEAAQNLVISYGHRAVTMDDIAMAVNITKAAIFHHFKNKRALLQDVVSAVAKEPLRAAKNAITAEAGLDENLSNLLVAAYSCTQYKSTEFMELADTFADAYRNIINQDTNALRNLTASLIEEAEEKHLITLKDLQISHQEFSDLLLMASYGVACPNQGPVLPPIQLERNISALITSMLNGVICQNSR